jgi:hypothetical protein
MILGFVFGLYAANSQSASGNLLIEWGGIVSLIIGIIVMLGGKGVSGIPGGLLTGFGLGATAGSMLWPPTAPLP